MLCVPAVWAAEPVSEVPPPHQSVVLDSAVMKEQRKGKNGKNGVRFTYPKAGSGSLISNRQVGGINSIVMAFENCIRY